MAPSRSFKNNTAQKTRHLYSLPADQAFLQKLAEKMWQDAKHDPLRFSDYTIILPTQDDVEHFKTILSDVLPHKIYFLPKIRALNQISPEDLMLTAADQPTIAQKLAKLPKPISKLERQILLAGEIMQMPELATSPQKALQLARELGHFWDEVKSHKINLGTLDQLVPPQFKRQWAKTEKFLKILTEKWPVILSQKNMIDHEDYLTTLTALYVAAWRAEPPKNPIIAAGFTVFDKKTDQLLDCISSLPKGAVIFSGFAGDHPALLPPAQNMTPTHPDYAVLKWLDQYHLTPQDIKPLQQDDAPLSQRERRLLVAETLRPSNQTDAWAKLEKAPKPSQIIKTAKKKKNTAAALEQITPENKGSIGIESLDGLDLIEAGTAQEEASVIALKMRETLEVKGRSAMLVTPDASLARRVSARLRHFGLFVSPHASLSLLDTQAGSLLSITARMMAENLAPIPLLEALKHHYARVHKDKITIQEMVQILEETALRGTRPKTGFDGLRHRAERAFNKHASPYSPTTQNEFKQWLSDFEQSSKAFLTLMQSDAPQPLSTILKAHIAFVEAFANGKNTNGPTRLWGDEDGQETARYLKKLLPLLDNYPALLPQDYPAVINQFLKDAPLKRPRHTHPFLKITTPAQARLIKADITIIGGLNNGTWPSAPKDNPWLSPSMQEALGLPSLLSSLGQSAFDFRQHLLSPKVVITRALREGNAPAIPSPFIHRLKLVTKAAGIDHALLNKNQLLSIHQKLHTPSSVISITPPAPIPPEAYRPKELSVSAIETLLRDPYSVYARNILKLFPQDEIDRLPRASDFGNFVHDALDRFHKKHQHHLPGDIEKELLKIGADIFEDNFDSASTKAFWWPRFERIAKWFAIEERERQKTTLPLATEITGKLEINKDFYVTARADRIDKSAQGGLIIIDYKTGVPPTRKSVEKGLSPQLLLEALIAEGGGFKGLDAGRVDALEYWLLKGRRPAGKIISIDHNLEQLKKDALSGVSALVQHFQEPKTPYLSVPDPKLTPRFNRYKHLARQNEWRFHQKSKTPSSKKTSKRK